LKTKIFTVGTMRTGGSLVSNMLSVHSQIMIFPVVVHFFRFIYHQYDPLTPENVERLLHHLRIRLKYRMNITIQPDLIFEAIMKRGISYAVCYDETMKYLVNITDKQIWGEYVTLQWRDVPAFLKMFQDGKVIHIYRDLRGILKSFGKLSFMPDHLYLNCIFNWIDSINHIKKYEEEIPRDRYMSIKFEDVHNNPEKEANRLCSFLNVPFEKAMIEGDKWPSLLNTKYVNAGMSVYTKKNVYGFDPERSKTWRNTIMDWELTLAEFLAHKQLEAAGYECVLTSYDAKVLRNGLNKLLKQDFLRSKFVHYFETGEGCSESPLDPTEPKNWGATEDGFSRFIETPTYQKYENELNEMESDLALKYASK
jgi:hypothetical protein